MIKDFLKSVADNIKQKVGNDLSHTIIIFPNKRASIFFNEYLVEKDTTPIWSPKYMSISEFFCSLSNLSPADSIDVICRLYNSYVKYTGNNESLDQFYGWGEQLLADFDDADKNMAPIEKMLRDLQNYNELESYDFLTDEQIIQLKRFSGDFKNDHLTVIRKNFQNLWSQAYNIYTDLNNDLANDNLAYEGKLFRNVVEGLQRGDIVLSNEIDKVAFVGFNAIDQVEKKLFEYLQQTGMALFYWDYDVWYTDDSNKTCEASLFINENLKNFPNALSETEERFDNFMQNRQNRSMEFVCASSENAQTQSIAEWLNGHKNCLNENARRTAIVLCNENLLEPTLHSLPPNIENINITKGFPLSHTPIFANILNLLDEANKSASKQEFKDTTANSLNARNKRYDFFKQTLLNIQERITNKAKEINTNRPENELLYVLYTESYYQAYTALNKFFPLIEKGLLNVNLNTLTRLIKQVMRTITIPFHGEPAIGVQIMGLLETRCLDFDNILMLSVNEGNLPQKTTDTSFIPYLIRKMYGLNTPERRVSVYAYYFYRLIQRAKNVRMMYNNSTETTSKGEMSRFMKALLIESNDKLNIKKLRQQCAPKPITLPQISAATAETQNTPLFTKLSPSALKKYIKCPLQFYYHYILNLRMPQTQDSIINANDFGTVFHKVAQNLYTKVLQTSQKGITPHTIESFLKNGGRAQIEAWTERAFLEHNISYCTITFRAITNYLLKLLKYEQNSHTGKDVIINQFYVAGAEDKAEIILQIPFKDTLVPLKLYGDIDRRDLAVTTDGKRIMRIIDYKTGIKREKVNYSMDALFSGNGDFPENALQIFIYSLMWTDKTDMQVSPMLYYIPSLSSNKFTPYICIDKYPVKDFHTIAMDFKEKLINLLADIIDPNKPFSPTENYRNCTYCDYKSICGK